MKGRRGGQIGMALAAAVALASSPALAASRQSTQARSTSETGTTTGVREPTVRLDLKDFCCIDYILVLRRAVAAKWDGQPDSAAAVMIRFTIQRNGRVSGSEVEQSSGIAAFDTRALRAVREAKLPPLPSAFVHPTLTVHLTFPSAQTEATSSSSLPPASPVAPPSPDRGQPARGRLGDALRNLEQYVKERDAPGPANAITFVGSDAEAVELGPWIRQFMAQVQRNWFLPREATTLTGVSVVRFTVTKAGEIRNTSVVKSSGVPQFDRAAVNALISSNPAQPLPSGYGPNEAQVIVNFTYNSRLAKR